ncbi:polyadenylate-binding protein-interacting protein 3 [Pelomyxa schiedti]|nr:polyadenylate-binding protein-interacting protein 3 [Pelomyxa schiedti]
MMLRTSTGESIVDESIAHCGDVVALLSLSAPGHLQQQPIMPIQQHQQTQVPPQQQTVMTQQPLNSAPNANVGVGVPLSGAPHDTTMASSHNHPQPKRGDGASTRRHNNHNNPNNTNNGGNVGRGGGGMVIMGGCYSVEDVENANNINNNNNNNTTTTQPSHHFTRQQQHQQQAHTNRRQHNNNSNNNNNNNHHQQQHKQYNNNNMAMGHQLGDIGGYGERVEGSCCCCCGDGSWENMAWVSALLIGCKVVVQVKDGSKYEGIFHSSCLDSHDGYGVVLQMAVIKAGPLCTDNKSDAASKSSDNQTLPLVIIPPEEFVQLQIEDWDYAIQASGLPTGSGFATDTEISAQRRVGGTERELTPWVAEDTNIIPDHLTLENTFSRSGSGWDQFKTNEMLFGVKSTYTEEQYTTVLNKNHPNYLKQVSTAERIAHEMEKQPTSNPHLAEERGIALPESAYSEEDRFSAVIQDGVMQPTERKSSSRFPINQPQFQIFNNGTETKPSPNSLTPLTEPNSLPAQNSQTPATVPPQAQPQGTNQPQLPQIYMPPSKRKLLEQQLQKQGQKAQIVTQEQSLDFGQGNSHSSAPLDTTSQQPPQTSLEKSLPSKQPLMPPAKPQALQPSIPLVSIPVKPPLIAMTIQPKAKFPSTALSSFTPHVPDRTSTAEEETTSEVKSGHTQPSPSGVSSPGSSVSKATPTTPRTPKTTPLTPRSPRTVTPTTTPTTTPATTPRAAHSGDHDTPIDSPRIKQEGDLSLSPDYARRSPVLQCPPSPTLHPHEMKDRRSPLFNERVRVRQGVITETFKPQAPLQSKDDKIVSVETSRQSPLMSPFVDNPKRIQALALEPAPPHVSDAVIKDFLKFSHEANLQKKKEEEQKVMKSLKDFHSQLPQLLAKKKNTSDTGVTKVCSPAPTSNATVSKETTTTTTCTATPASPPASTLPSPVVKLSPLAPSFTPSRLPAPTKTATPSNLSVSSITLNPLAPSFTPGKKASPVNFSS